MTPQTTYSTLNRVITNTPANVWVVGTKKTRGRIEQRSESVNWRDKQKGKAG